MRLSWMNAFRIAAVLLLAAVSAGYAVGSFAGSALLAHLTTLLR